MTRAMLTNREQLLETLAREELGLDPQALGSPWGAAISSFCAFALGAVIPLVPFLVERVPRPELVAAILSGVSLFGIGFTLLVLTLAAAMLDHIFGAFPPETRPDRILSVQAVKMEGKESVSTGPAGYAFFDRYFRNLPGVERMSLMSQPSTVVSYWKGARLKSILKRTDADFFRFVDRNQDSSRFLMI